MTKNQLEPASKLAIPTQEQQSSNLPYASTQNTKTGGDGGEGGGGRGGGCFESVFESKRK